MKKILIVCNSNGHFQTEMMQLVKSAKITEKGDIHLRTSSMSPEKIAENAVRYKADIVIYAGMNGLVLPDYVSTVLKNILQVKQFAVETKNLDRRLPGMENVTAIEVRETLITALKMVSVQENVVEAA